MHRYDSFERIRHVCRAGIGSNWNVTDWKAVDLHGVGRKNEHLKVSDAIGNVSPHAVNCTKYDRANGRLCNPVLRAANAVLLWLRYSPLVAAILMINSERAANLNKFSGRSFRNSASTSFFYTLCILFIKKTLHFSAYVLEYLNTFKFKIKILIIIY